MHTSLIQRAQPASWTTPFFNSSDNAATEILDLLIIGEMNDPTAEIGELFHFLSLNGCMG